MPGVLQPRYVYRKTWPGVPQQSHVIHDTGLNGSSAHTLEGTLSVAHLQQRNSKIVARRNDMHPCHVRAKNFYMLAVRVYLVHVPYSCAGLYMGDY